MKNIYHAASFLIAALLTINSSFGQTNSAKFELSAGNSPVTQPSAATSFNAKIYPGSNPARFILVTENPYRERVCITVTGSNGKLYQKVTRQKKVRTIFDLSTAENDQYSLSISSQSNQFSRQLVLSSTYASASKTVEIK
jgi:hypothetical protein